MKLVIRVIKVTKEDEGYDGFKAFIENKPEYRGEGRTKAEAVGDLILIWQKWLKGIIVHH